MNLNNSILKIDIDKIDSLEEAKIALRKMKMFSSALVSEHQGLQKEHHISTYKANASSQLVNSVFASESIQMGMKFYDILSKDTLREGTPSQIDQLKLIDQMFISPLKKTYKDAQEEYNKAVQQGEDLSKFRFPEFVLDIDSRTLSKGENLVVLTKMEVKVLELLCKYPNKCKDLSKITKHPSPILTKLRNKTGFLGNIIETVRFEGTRVNVSNLLDK